MAGPRTPAGEVSSPAGEKTEPKTAVGYLG